MSPNLLESQNAQASIRRQVKCEQNHLPDESSKSKDETSEIMRPDLPNRPNLDIEIVAATEDSTGSIEVRPSTAKHHPITAKVNLAQNLNKKVSKKSKAEV